MGTNFYWKKIPKEFERYKANVEKISVYGVDNNNENVLKHIGKRSGAGAYCYHCGVTLNKHGTDRVHDCDYSEWYKRCSICGREGVATISFRWTFLRQKWLIQVLAMERNNEKCIVDEYGKEYTPQEFLQAVKTPIEFQSCCEFM